MSVAICVPAAIFVLAGIFVLCLFCCFTYQVNSYGHGETVSSPHHMGKLEEANYQNIAYFRLKLTTTLLELISGREGKGRRNYFIDFSPLKYEYAGIELATSRSAVRHASVARHVTD